MAVHVDSSGRHFQLDAGDSSYVLEATEEGALAHWYWGPKLRSSSPVHRRELLVPRAFAPRPFPEHEEFSYDVLPQEYPTWGRGDFRSPAYQVRLDDGSAVTDLRFQAYRHVPGKPRLAGLPHIYVDDPQSAETLIVVLYDAVADLKVELVYTALADLNAIVRSAKFYNQSPRPLVLERALSASVDLPEAGWDWIRLVGAWGRERKIERTVLGLGMGSVESRRGASSHQANPFLALADSATGERSGRVWAMQLIYSGNFRAQAEVDGFENTRMAIGIDPFQFQWTLAPHETFQTPEAVLVFSHQGLGTMSETFHDLYRQHLMREPWRSQERPIVLNSWEATAFDFDEKKLVELADVAQSLGVETLVLDDGWFGQRNDARSSLGDWVPNHQKLPQGLIGLAKKVHDRGLQFGLWVEPEMVSPASDLYRAHPDWCLHVPHRPRTEGRHQLVLDLSRDDVVAWIIGWMTDLLTTTPIDYIKWDMNRNMTEVGSPQWPADRQAEISHRYMLGLYHVLETLTARFPQVLFEGCSGGGGRFDPGMLYYMPETWTSDDSDAIDRLVTQYGTSLVYPPIAMTAHVSQVPSQQVGRITPLTTRAWVAMSATFGYELDVTRLSAEEREAIGRQITVYKALRPLVQFGRFYRLLDPAQGNEASWMFVSGDGTEGLVVWVNRMAEPAAPVRWLHLTGLRADRDYDLSEWTEEGSWQFRGRYGGDRLINIGIATRAVSDFGVRAWRLQA